MGKEVNPITNTNWEHTGVRPDIAISGEDALKAAHIMAIERLIAKEESNERRGSFEHVLADVKQHYESRQ